MIFSQKKQQIKGRQQGFTIIELLVIIVVIGVLAGLTIVGYGTIQRNAADASIESDLRSMADVQEIYRLDNPSTAGFAYPDGPADDRFTPSDENNVVVTLSGGGYCIYGYKSGSSFPDANEPMTYDSLAGGLGQSGGACEAVAPESDPDPEPATFNERVIADAEAVLVGLRAFKNDGNTMPFNDTEGNRWGADICSQHWSDCTTTYSWFYDPIMPYFSETPTIEVISDSNFDRAYYSTYNYNEGNPPALNYYLEGNDQPCGISGANTWNDGAKTVCSVPI